MTGLHGRTVALAVIASLVVIGPVAAAIPQDQAEAAPQPNRALTLQSPVIGYGIMALAAAALVGVSLMRSKRGAQE